MQDGLCISMGKFAMCVLRWLSPSAAEASTGSMIEVLGTLIQCHQRLITCSILQSVTVQL